MTKKTPFAVIARRLQGVDAAAIRLGVSTRQVRLLCERGELASIKIGRDWVIDKTAKAS